MMKPFAVMTAVLMLVSGSLYAVQAGQGAAGNLVDAKIAFVNTTVVLQSVAEGKTGLAEIEQYVASQRRPLDEKNSELETLKSQYSSQARMLNPDTAAEMQQTIAEKERQLRRLQEDLELSVNVITEFAEQNGYGAVFMESPQLPFLDSTLDITATIIRLYDEKYPVAGAGGTAAQPPAQTPPSP
jgi:outer membrane protein